MKRHGTFDLIQCQDGVVLAVLSISHTYAMPTHMTCPHIQTTAGYTPAQSILTLHIDEKDGLNKRSTKHANKSMLVAGGAAMQLRTTRGSCVSAPLVTNVDLWNPIAQGDKHDCC